MTTNRAPVRTILATVGGAAMLGFLTLNIDWSAFPLTPATPALAVTSPFLYTFKIDGVLNESGDPEGSTSPYWWLNSGGQLILKDGTGSTMRGAAPLQSRWQSRYARANSEDTDAGAHPQNLFRLLSRSLWENVRVEGSFRILSSNLSESENRNASNGILLMNRYSRDGQTLYYAGVRVDGHAVIKKKYKGVYYTLAEKQVFPGSYDRTTKPNLLPQGEWIAMRLETVTNPDGAIQIRLYLKREGGSAWNELVSAVDSGNITPLITGPAMVGVRTDFMDVAFDDMRIERL